MADHLLQQAVADRHAAGDGEMGADRAGEPEEAEQTGPAAVELGDAPGQADDLRGDEDEIEDRARADRRHHRHPPRRRRDLPLHLAVDRPQQRAFGDIDQSRPSTTARRASSISARARAVSGRAA